MMDYTPLSQWGIPGFIIIVLSGVIAYQNRKIEALQNARIADAKDTVAKVTVPLSGISQTINLIYDRLKSSKEQA
jgi:hypothetical protein